MELLQIVQMDKHLGELISPVKKILMIFGSLDENLEFNDSLKRYGFNKTSLYGWEKFDERFDLAKNMDEANRFGWIVEINPFDAQSTPVKRTSLGRFKHENAEIIVEKDGSVIVYMGDDEMNEFIYKFVSKHKYKKVLIQVKF